jgi:DNA-binding response OmpR family regulator
MAHALVETQLAAAGFDPDAVERIRSILGLTGEPEQEPVTVGPLEIDPRTHRVTFAGERVLLAQKEFALLWELARDPIRVFRKEELLRSVWGFRSSARTRTLDSHASRLRCKLRAVDSSADYVVNVWGVGYRLFDT